MADDRCRAGLYCKPLVRPTHASKPSTPGRHHCAPPALPPSPSTALSAPRSLKRELTVAWSPVAVSGAGAQVGGAADPSVSDALLRRQHAASVKGNPKLKPNPNPKPRPKPNPKPRPKPKPKPKPKPNQEREPGHRRRRRRLLAVPPSLPLRRRVPPGCAYSSTRASDGVQRSGSSAPLT